MRATLLTAAVLLSHIAMYGFYTIDGSGKAKKSLGLPKRTAVSAALVNAAISMPTKPFNGKPNPGVVVGLRKPATQKSKHLTVGVEAGFAAQSGLQNIAFVKPNVGYTINITPSIQVSPIIGAGVLVSRRVNSEFAPVNTAGNITYKASGAYTPHLITSFGIEPSAQVYKGTGMRAQVYMRYDFATQSNFAHISSLLPLTMLQLGLRLQGK